MSFIDDLTNIILGASSLGQRFEDAVTDGEVLVENIRAEARKIKQFKADPKWKTRVINVPAAIKQTHDLVTDLSGTISDAFHAFISNVRAIRRIDRLPPPERGGGGGATLKILHILEEINNFVGEVDALFKSLNALVDSMRKIQDELEGFDTLFLQQGNSRRFIHSADGTEVLKVRVGALHGE